MLKMYAQEAQTTTDQTTTNAEDVAQEAQTTTDQTATNAEDVAQEAQTTTDQTATGANIGQEAQQQAEQQAFGADTDQKIGQTATQIATSAEDLGSEESSNVQQAITQIAKQTALGGGDVTKFIGDLSTQITNNPKSELAKSLGDSAGLYSSGNYDGFNQVAKQLGTQIAIGNGKIEQNMWQTFNNFYGDIIIKDKDEWNTKINYDIYYDRHYEDYDDYDDDDDYYYYDDDDDHDVKIIKKIYKRDNSCPTQSDSLQFKGKIIPRGVIILADFYPCDLRDGRATLNIPNNPNLKFVVLTIDKKGNNHEGAIITKEKIQSLSKDNGLYVVNFDDQMSGKNPVTGKKIVLDEIKWTCLV